jgi:hypothetical protein
VNRCGYAATREEAMAAFAKSWRGEVATSDQGGVGPFGLGDRLSKKYCGSSVRHMTDFGS